MRSKLCERSGWESRRMGVGGGGGSKRTGGGRGRGGSWDEVEGWRAGQIGENYATMLHISQSILDQTEKAEEKMEEAGNVTYGERKVWIPPSTHKRFFLACVAGAWKKWVKERAGAPERDTRGVTPSRAHVFCCAHFFQAPATQARIFFRRTTNENMKI